MAKTLAKSGVDNGENYGGLASQCPFEFESGQKQECAVAEHSPNLPIERKRSARPSKSLPVPVNGSLSLFPDEVPTSSSKPHQDEAGAVVPLNPRVSVLRVSAGRLYRQRISGLQKITSAAETVSSSAFAVWSEFEKHAHEHTETTKAGEQIVYLLSGVGRTQLIKLTGKSRKTVRMAIIELKRRHLIALHASADSYMRKAEVYKLSDPYAAAERMRVEDGLSVWRQKGRGRVLL